LARSSNSTKQLAVGVEVQHPAAVPTYNVVDDENSPVQPYRDFTYSGKCLFRRSG
jgi:hypothetical protein